MPDTTFTFRVNQNLKDAFADVAHKRDRSAAQLLRDFMREYIQQDTDYDQWFAEQVNIGIAAADAGKLIPSSEVEAHFAAKRAALLKGSK